MSEVLEIRAGRKALERIRECGLNPDSVDVMVGASGGPKWFVLTGLDKALMGEFFKDRQRPLHLLGTSAGSWRFCCYAQNDALAAHERFEQGYLMTSYSARPDAAEISREARQLVKDILGTNGAREIIENPVMRFNLIAVRSHGLGRSERKGPLMAGMSLAAASNMISRKSLNAFFTRTLFHPPGEKAPFYAISDLRTQRVELSEDNLAKAVLASGSIPIVMEGVRNIPDAPAGIYRDGGVTDYHFDIKFAEEDQLVLYPHFYRHMIPGWFDKGLKWRRPSPENCDNVVLVSPSADFVSRLPHGKIPDRNDFKNLPRDERIKYWRVVIRESERLGEAFLELTGSGRIRQTIRPL
ncbi:MAG: patatin-like phospholipase family protein [Endozoicomonas sp.]